MPHTCWHFQQNHISNENLLIYHHQNESWSWIQRWNFYLSPHTNILANFSFNLTLNTRRKEAASQFSEHRKQSWNTWGHWAYYFLDRSLLVMNFLVLIVTAWVSNTFHWSWRISISTQFPKSAPYAQVGPVTNTWYANQKFWNQVTKVHWDKLTNTWYANQIFFQFHHHWCHRLWSPCKPSNTKGKNNEKLILKLYKTRKYRRIWKIRPYEKQGSKRAMCVLVHTNR